MYQTLIQKRNKEELLRNIAMMFIAAVVLVLMFFLVTHCAWAEADSDGGYGGSSTNGSVQVSIDNYKFGSNTVGKIKSVTNAVVNVIVTIFQAVGVIMSVFSVGQMVLAFKNEDADSKSRASLLLVCGLALIAIPAIVKSLDLINLITG
jgi:hypothetical protein